MSVRIDTASLIVHVCMSKWVFPSGFTKIHSLHDRYDLITCFTICHGDIDIIIIIIIKIIASRDDDGG